MIKLNNIVVKFGDFVALHDINVHVKEGEFFTFLGPSGCGKTTTLRTITGFIEPASGTVVVKDRDITHVPIEERNIGIVFQSYALFPTMTVYDNIAFGLKIKKLRKDEIERKVREIAKKVDLSGLDSISERSTPIEIAKVFTELFGRFKKAMPPENYNDMRSRPERNAYTLFFAGVLMSRLDAAAKERMVKTFASDAAGVASNTMQTLISGGTDLTPVENDDLQDSAQMMRKCSTFIADDLSLDAEAFAVNEVKDNMKLADIPAEVADQYAGFIHAIQG